MTPRPNHCDECKEHSGVMTLLEVHSKSLGLIESRLFYLGVGIFLCFLTGLVGIFTAKLSAPSLTPSPAGAAEIRQKFERAGMDIRDTIVITRKESSSAGTLGVISVNSRLMGFTLEPPKKGNKRGISCIPTGDYVIKKYFSEKYRRECFKIYDVHGRDYISLHNGNFCRDTKGCILIGKSIGTTGSKRSVQYSRQALEALVAMVGDTCMLTIKEEF